MFVSTVSATSCPIWCAPATDTADFGGCGVAAAHCDLDHVIPVNHDNPHAGGPTTAENRQCLCRWHHRLKTCGDWTVTALPEAVMAWTSPTGSMHETLPHGGKVVSHHDADTEVCGTAVPDPPPVAPPHPEEFADPPGWDGDLPPDPWDQVGLQVRINRDPLTAGQVRQLDDDTRFRRPPDDPEELHIVQVVQCACPPPF